MESLSRRSGIAMDKDQTHHLLRSGFGYQMPPGPLVSIANHNSIIIFAPAPNERRELNH
jgi:hypothetical protein